MIGHADTIIAGGAESMSLVPMMGHVTRPNAKLAETAPEYYMGMGHTAEEVAKKYGISREDQDAFAVRSHQKAAKAIAEGKFADEIVPVDVTIINELDLEIPKGEITVFIGGNGCGKSTLLRSIARLLKPKSGAVLLDGEAIARLSTKDVARKMAILPQSPSAPEGLTVLQLVKQGRYPYQTWLKQWTAEDEEKVNNALEATGLMKLKDRAVDSLSGGQRQRAWIAMTLAQDTDLISAAP